MVVFGGSNGMRLGLSSGEHHIFTPSQSDITGMMLRPADLFTLPFCDLTPFLGFQESEIWWFAQFYGAAPDRRRDGLVDRTQNLGQTTQNDDYDGWCLSIGFSHPSTCRQRIVESAVFVFWSAANYWGRFSQSAFVDGRHSFGRLQRFRGSVCQTILSDLNKINLLKSHSIHKTNRYMIDTYRYRYI